MNKSTKESIIEFKESLDLLNFADFQDSELMQELASVRAKIGDIFTIIKSSHRPMGL